MMPKMYIGIDPGKTGGIVAVIITESDECGYSFSMPLTDDYENTVDVCALQDSIINLCLLHKVQIFHIYAVIEVQQRGKSISSQEGRLTALLDLMQIRRFNARPQEWQKEIFSRLEEVPEDTKEASIKFCKMYDVDLPTLTETGNKLHDGIADAFCMAVYCRHIVENS